MAADLTSLDTIQSQNPVRAVITRFPFLVYAILTLLLGWIPWYAGGQPSHLFFVPLLTALIMAPLVGGREGLLNFLRRMVRVRAPWYTWLVALLLPGAIALVAIAVHVLLGGQLVFASTFDTRLLTINAVLIGLTVIGFIIATRGELGNTSSRERGG
jgi:hypothetical protein